MDFKYSYIIFWDTISRFFDITDAPDGSKVFLEIKEDYFDNEECWTQLLKETGHISYVIGDDNEEITDSIICHAREQFIDDLERYINLDYMIKDNLKRGLHIAELLEDSFFENN